MKVVVKKVGEIPKVVDIENSLEVLQSFVGGYIEVVPVTENTLMICNEEGKLNNLKYNFDLGKDIIVGDVLFVDFKGEDFTDINDASIETIMHYFSKTPYTT